MLGNFHRRAQLYLGADRCDSAKPIPVVQQEDEGIDEIRIQTPQLGLQRQPLQARNRELTSEGRKVSF